MLDLNRLTEKFDCFELFDIIFLLFADVHNKTGVDLDVVTASWFGTPLPDGDVVSWLTSNETVVRMNSGGVIERDLYTGSLVRGLLLQGSDLFILHRNGTIVQVQLDDGLILNVYDTGIGNLHNYASHQTDICKVPYGIVHFTSFRYGMVHAYNICSQTMKVLVENLNKPYSVTPACINCSIVYVVTERDAHKVHVYNASWSLMTSFGGFGTGDGQLNTPRSSVMSDKGHIYVADYQNYRVSMFTSDGLFVKHIITYYESNERPMTLSVRGKHLCVTTIEGRLTRYIL